MECRPMDSGYAQDKVSHPVSPYDDRALVPSGTAAGGIGDIQAHEGRGYGCFLFYRWRGPPVRLEFVLFLHKGRGRKHLPRPLIFHRSVK